MSKTTAIANILDRANVRLAQQAGSTYTNNQERAQAIANTTGIDPVNSDVCRVLIAFRNHSTNNPEDMLLAVANTLGDGVQPVRNSFQATDGTGSHFVGLVTKGMATCTMDEDSFNQRFTQVAKNVLMDNEDQSVWNLVSNDKGATVLARQIDEDLSDLIAIACLQNHNNKNFQAVDVALPVVAGYASFYNPAIKSVDFGYVCGSEADGKIIAVSRTLNDLVELDERLLVSCASIHQDSTEFQLHRELNEKGIECPAHLLAGMKSQRMDVNPFSRNVTTALTTSTEEPLDPQSVSYENMREYYRQMYAYAPEYYKEFEKLITDSGF